MKTLRLASFGIRGYVGESLTLQAVMDFASAFATFVDGRRVLLGRDTRYSSPMLQSAVTASLLQAGCDVLDAGVCPTPVLQFCVPRQQAGGAISITGGHNPQGWNALILIGPDGAFIEPAGGETVLDFYHARDFFARDGQGLGRVRPLEEYAPQYFSALAAQLDVEAIGRAKFTVLVDPVGGAGCPFLAPFAAALGLQLIPINGEPSGYLAREAEPRPRSARQMAAIIRHVGGQAGFVLSSDMGRVSLVTEAGEPASEEYSFAVLAQHVLQRTPGLVVTNCCTTRMIDDVAAENHSTVVKTRVGQAYIQSRLADERGVLGGEGSGSAALPAFSPAFDGFLMMGKILEAMAQSGRPLSELIHALPRYHIVKRELPLDSRAAYRAIENLARHFQAGAGATVDWTDGVRFDWPDGWVHARVSRTQQMVRVISESSERVRAEERSETVARILAAAPGGRTA